MNQRLPGVLSEVADVAGEPAAVLLASRVGGTRVFIPAKVSDGHWLVDCVGRQKAELICKHFTVDGRGQRIDVPLGGAGAYPQLRRAIAKRVHDLDLSNKSSSQIAREVGITERTVHRHRSSHRGTTNRRQGKLF
jgi:hypothetical protein